MLHNRQRELSIAVAILAIAAALAAVAPAFFTFANVRDLLLANVPVLIVAVGMTLIVITAQIDISVGSQFAICSVAAGVFAISGLPMFAALIAATLTGAVLGAINGVLIAWVRIPSIVVTLAAMVALRDGLRWVTQGAWVQNLPPGFHWFGMPQAASEWLTIGAAAAITAIAAWGLRHLAAGRAVYMPARLGSTAPRLAGIDPQYIVFGVFAPTTGPLPDSPQPSTPCASEQIPSNTGIGLELKVVPPWWWAASRSPADAEPILGALLGDHPARPYRPRSNLSAIPRCIGSAAIEGGIISGRRPPRTH